MAWQVWVRTLLIFLTLFSGSWHILTVNHKLNHIFNYIFLVTDLFKDTGCNWTLVKRSYYSSTSPRVCRSTTLRWQNDRSSPVTNVVVKRSNHLTFEFDGFTNNILRFSYYSCLLPNFINLCRISYWSLLNFVILFLFLLTTTIIIEHESLL